jgi:hypothetical protein
VESFPAASLDATNAMPALAVVEALEFVRKHGVVLASAKGAAPRLIDAIADEAIVGNWWSHPNASAIYNVLSAVQESDDVLVCKLLEGRVTLVHRRLWPALARLAEKFMPEQIAKFTEEHTESGRHVSRTVAFPHWVPSEVMQQAQLLSEKDVHDEFASWLPAARQIKSSSSSTARRKARPATSGV